MARKPLDVSGAGRTNLIWAHYALPVLEDHPSCKRGGIPGWPCMSLLISIGPFILITYVHSIVAFTPNWALGNQCPYHICL